MTDYLCDYDISKSGWTLTAYNRHDVTVVGYAESEHVIISSPEVVRLFKLEGLHTASSVGVAREIGESLHGITAFDTMPFLESSLGNYLVTIRGAEISVDEGEKTVMVLIYMTALGTTTDYWFAYELTDLMIETNDWSI